MAEKSILLAVVDSQTATDIAQTLGEQWETTTVSTEPEALAQLEHRSFDAFLVDFNLGVTDGSELLNQALEKRPDIVRFLLAYEADLALVAAKVFEPYQILPKPIECDSLKRRIESGVIPEESGSDQVLNDLSTDAGTAPATASIYAEVLNALNTLGTTNAQVAEIIAQDPALTSELLELTHSAYQGMPRKITDPVEAVESLGLETVKALVMAQQFLSEHSKSRPGYLSFEQVWRHSTNVARMARDLVLFETQDRALASEALIAGLLHDLGKVVLVTNFGDLYGRVHSLARKQPVPIWEIEKEIFGANHGEVGGCLIGMWNMPFAVAEAAALHHEPPLGEHERLDALVAVHIANVFEHEIRPNAEGMVAPIMNTALLNELGLLERLPVWRAAIAKRSFAKPEPRPESPAAKNQKPVPRVALATPPSRSANQLGGPTAPTRTTTSGAPQPSVPVSSNRQVRWVYAGAALGLLTVLALWFGRRPEPVYARIPTPAQASAVISSNPPAEIAHATVPGTTSVPNTPAVASAPDISSPTPPELALFSTEPQPTVPIAPQAAVTTAPLPSAPPKEKGPPDFRVYGIIYSARPSAIVNGETISVGDRINGALVVNIGRTNVTLRVNGQRKTYTLQ